MPWDCERKLKYPGEFTSVCHVGWGQVVLVFHCMWVHGQVYILNAYHLIFMFSQNEDKKPDHGSLEDLSQDQPDQALLGSEPINSLRRSPMIRNRKTGSMEVVDHSVSVSRINQYIIIKY